MYSKEQITEACKTCGINSVATSRLIEVLNGDTTKTTSLLPQTDHINVDSIEFSRIGKSFYFVSRCGKIYSSKRRRILKPSSHGNYLVFTLSDGLSYTGQSRRKKIHRTVAEMYVPNPENKPFINHIDGNKTNNHYANLEWVTHEENTKHYNTLHKATTGFTNAQSKVTNGQMDEIINLRQRGVSCKEIGKIFGMHEASVLNQFKQRGIQFM